jgi:NOL1/NOP2/sun family putative RNA methylase
MSFKHTFFPTEFINKYKPMLGEEWPSFFEAIQNKRPKAFWVNTNIATISEVMSSLTAKGIRFQQLPFHKQAFSIEMERPSELPEYQKAQISLQEKASMLPVVALNPQKNDYVFDTCASPGMKTIQLSNLSEKVLATEVHSKRFAILTQTQRKFSLENVAIKRIDFRNVKRNKRFDKVLLDAPCSSEGVVRKKREALLEWSQKLVLKKAEEQKHMITRAFDYLKEGGEMVYSTCSFAPEENEEVVNYLLGARRNAEVIPIELNGIKIRENKLCKNCVRLYPQDNNTQQFFLAKIKKAL